MSMLDEKRIETLTMKVKDIKTGFGNPRKIGKKEAEELEESLEKYGDFGLFLIDEHDNVIAGNQRLSILQRKDGDIEVLCKRLRRLRTHLRHTISPGIRDHGRSVETLQLGLRRRVMQKTQIRQG